MRRQIRQTPRRDEAYGHLLDDLRKFWGGWANYFKHSREAERKFRALEWFTRGQLLSWHLRRLGSGRTASATNRVVDHLRSLPRMVQPNHWERKRDQTTAC